jgi:hypothetical protein
MNKIEMYDRKTHAMLDLTEEEFLKKFEELRQKWEPGWYVMHNDVTHQILPGGRMDSIPNNEVFKDMIRRGVW